MLKITYYWEDKMEIHADCLFYDGLKLTDNLKVVFAPIYAY